MNLSNYDIIYLGKKADELGFIRDTLEKVARLADILEFFNSNPLLRGSLALKGGTSINLTIFNLPRLSVDIDLDYLKSDTKEIMLDNRLLINTIVDKFMVSQGYTKSIKTRNPHSLDSWNYAFINAAGNKDNIKIEINYSLRSHIFPSEERFILTKIFLNKYKVKTLSPIEIFGSKINALLNRTAARDLYDVNNMIRYGIFNDIDKELLKKCVVFYAAITAKKIEKKFDTSVIDAISKHKIKTDLLPVIKKKDDFNLDIAKNSVKEYINSLMTLNEKETEFLERFVKKEYVPALLFSDPGILESVNNHPMALWKIRKNNF